MYKSRVETFNQVHHFHHPIFLLLFILQDDDMRKQTAVLHLYAWTEVQKWNGESEQCWGSVVTIAPQVADPVSSSPVGARLSYCCASQWFRLSWFSSWQVIWRKRLCNRTIQGQKTNALPLCYWNDETVIWSILSTKWYNLFNQNNLS